MRIEFPKTLAAAQKKDGATWALGDAMLLEIDVGKNGVKNENTKRFEACAMELKDHGIEHTIRWLQVLHSTAHRFPARSRLHAASISVHTVAGSPENLKRLLAALKKADKRISRRNAVDMMKAWAADEAAERARRATDASNRHKDAIKKKKEANSVETAKAATEEAKRAAEEYARYVGSPKSGEDYVSTPAPADVLSVRMACFKIEADCQLIVQELTKSLNKIDSMIDKIEPDFANGLIKHHTRIITEANAIINKFEKRHALRSIQGGAA